MFTRNIPATILLTEFFPTRLLPDSFSCQLPSHFSSSRILQSCGAPPPLDVYISEFILKFCTSLILLVVRRPIFTCDSTGSRPRATGDPSTSCIYMAITLAYTLVVCHFLFPSFLPILVLNLDPPSNDFFLVSWLA